MYKKPVFFHSVADIDHIKVGETPESLVLDFKREFNGTEKHSEFAADICSFANKWGGAILFGVDEGNNELKSHKVASRLTGVDDAEKIREKFNTVIKDCIYPQTIRFETVIINQKDGKPFVAINIPAHADGVCCAKEKGEKAGYKFPIRTEYGKEYMTMATVEKNYSSDTRRIMLRMRELCGKRKREAEIISPVQTVEYLLVNPFKSNLILDGKGLHKEKSLQDCEVIAHIARLGMSDFELHINQNPRKIPYGLVSEVWKTESNKIGLFLKISIIIDPEGKFQLKA